MAMVSKWLTNPPYVLFIIYYISHFNRPFHSYGLLIGLHTYTQHTIYAYDQRFSSHTYIHTHIYTYKHTHKTFDNTQEMVVSFEVALPSWPIA